MRFVLIIEQSNVIIKHSSERHLNYIWAKTVRLEMACADKPISC